MPIYEYQHPETKEIFEDMRKMEDRDKPFIAPDGVKCERIFASNLEYVGRPDKNKECFEVDREYVHKAKPKYIKFRDGHRERFDPTRHI